MDEWDSYCSYHYPAKPQLKKGISSILQEKNEFRETSNLLKVTKIFSCKIRIYMEGLLFQTKGSVLHENHFSRQFTAEKLNCHKFLEKGFLVLSIFSQVFKLLKEVGRKHQMMNQNRFSEISFNGTVAWIKTSNWQFTILRNMILGYQGNPRTTPSSVKSEDAQYPGSAFASTHLVQAHRTQAQVSPAFGSGLCCGCPTFSNIC